MDFDVSRAGRATCYRCFKPRPGCVCGDVVRVDNRTGVIVLQHPRERNHPFGTERFARLGLRRVDVRECGPRDAAAMARAAVFPPRTALVYPSEAAVEVGRLAADERPEHIIVVDGTWHHSRSIVRSVPGLLDLPRICLDPAEPSEYRVRREPRPDCLSTIEATVGVLRSLEPETEGLDGLLTAFRKMIDRQVDRSRHALERRTWGPRKQRKHVPRAFTSRFSRLIVVHGEVVWEPGGTRPPEVVYWCAQRPATGEQFARFVRPDRAPLDDARLADLGLRREQVLGGLPFGQFEAEWERFCGPDAIVAAWNRDSLRALVSPGDALSLRGVAGNLCGRPCGHLDDFVARCGLTATPNPFEGRAGRLMGGALAVAAHLRGLGSKTDRPGYGAS